MSSMDLSFHNPLVNGGRSYGGSFSALINPIVPLRSTSRIPCTAASAVMPPPMMRYLKPAMEQRAPLSGNIQWGAASGRSSLRTSQIRVKQAEEVVPDFGEGALALEIGPRQRPRLALVLLKRFRQRRREFLAVDVEVRLVIRVKGFLVEVN